MDKIQKNNSFFRESIPYRCRTFQIETAINYKEKIFGLNFFNLKCTQVISDYFIHSFVAVFIVADIFMCSIDAITSKTKVYIVFSSYSVASLKWKKYCLFCRKLLYQAQTAPRKRLKFPFGMELRPISF